MLASVISPLREETCWSFVRVVLEEFETPYESQVLQMFGTVTRRSLQRGIWDYAFEILEHLEIMCLEWDSIG